ncbi:hypothetical protein BJP36_06280 [Moorena producens JHB]|uniref:Uncharacterized protein n=1 Tax=Moorena producens (strain JHB) TaxID=1454205 RepID=A0A1D9FWD3_MOOP1|nr:hypothetical protein [Moorena producens]AOY79584.1 hypothetical protein BJP36_06280 [Moorena producens JHB]
MDGINKAEMRERLGNLEKIRDIIIGSKLREYDTHFTKIESDLSMWQQEIRDRVEQLKTTLSKEIAAGVDSLEKKISNLSLTAAEERNEIQERVELLNKKFSKSIEVLDETVYKQSTSLKKALSETKEQHQQDVMNIRKQILAELETKFAQLKDAKASKADLGDMLLELGLRLKGTELVPALKEASDGWSGLPQTKGHNGTVMEKTATNDDEHLQLIKQTQTLE